MNHLPIRSFLLLLILAVLISCSKEENVISDVSDPQIESDADLKICTELYPEDHARAFGSKQLFWDKKILRVRFLDGSSYVQNKVKEYARVWSQHAGITFEFVNSEPSDIRISFDNSSGSWSYVGKSNNYISSSRATMNFGWFNNNTSDTEFRRTTLHEFGHALGLSHEHQHPLADINWNRDAVYAYYERTQDWSASDVDANIFRKYSTATTNYSAYDPLSIMHYYIPRSLVLGSWTPTSNTRLSSTDIAFIGAMYPGTGTDPEEPVLLDCNCPEGLMLVACDDFESYDELTFLDADQWGIWSPNSGNAEFQTYNWGKVIKMKYYDINNPDILFTPGSFTEGQYRLSWDMYVRQNASAYFNIQKEKVAGEEFGAQFYFQGDQSGTMYISDQEVQFDYAQEQWNNIGLVFDFVNNQMIFEINATSVATWPLSWSARTEFGSAQFNAINFYAADEDAQFWLDDFCMSDINGAISDVVMTPLQNSNFSAPIK